jgi:hypothetical protein
VCHGNVTNSQEERARFFFLNQEFLLDQKYKPTEHDLEIVVNNPFLVESEHYKRVYGNKY